MINTSAFYIKINRPLLLFLILSAQSLFAQLEVAINQSNTLKPSRVTDSLALVNLYETTDGIAWLHTWDLAAPLDTWYGVQLNDYGRVMCLDLDGDPDCSARKGAGNNLSGNLPDLHLPELEHLFMAGNHLEGELPDFQHLDNLLTLQLCCNYFSGKIPDFTHLKRLNSLELDYNRLTGKIPDFSNIPKLENLYLSDNRLSGKIPSFENLPQLRRLYLHKNKLDKCPEAFQTTQLMELLLMGNQLTGRLADLANLTEVQYLSVRGNMLSGDIPDLHHMPRLIDADFSRNRFSGSIPLVKDQTYLRSIKLSGNQLEGGANWKNLPALSLAEVSDNYLSFSELEEFSDFLKNENSYANQLIDTENEYIVLEEGESMILNLDFDKNVDKAVYTWYANGQEVKVQSGKAKFFKEEISQADYGVWFCEVEHPDFPGLTLQSQDYIIAATAEELEDRDDSEQEEEIDPNALAEEKEWIIPESFWTNRDSYYVLPESIKESTDGAAVQLLIADANGRVIYQSSDYQNDWDGSDSGSSATLPVGVYFYRIASGIRTQSGSLLIVRE